MLSHLQAPVPRALSFICLSEMCQGALFWQKRSSNQMSDAGARRLSMKSETTAPEFGPWHVFASPWHQLWNIYCVFWVHLQCLGNSWFTAVAWVVTKEADLGGSSKATAWGCLYYLVVCPDSQFNPASYWYTPLEDQDAVRVSWLCSHLALAVVNIWGMNQWMEVSVRLSKQNQQKHIYWGPSLCWTLN